MEKDTTAHEPSTPEDKPAVTAPASDASSKDKTAAGQKTSPRQDHPSSTPAAGQHSAGIKTPPPEKKRGKGKTIVVLLLLILLAGGGYFGWYRYGDVLTAQSLLPAGAQSGAGAAISASPSPSIAGELQGAVSPELEQKLEQVAGQSAQQAETLLSLQNRVADLQLLVNAQQERLQALSTTTREDWLLAEADYLLKLANQRILTERQGKNALSMMESADTILKNLDDPDLFPVRKALADDITRLRVAGVVDREGLFLRLDALMGIIPKLDIPIVQLKEAEQPQPVDGQPWYQRLAANALQALKKLSGVVRVEKLQDAPEPRLLPSEQQMLRINLRLALEQAQLALMREEQKIYRASLEHGRVLITQSFMEDEDAKVMLAELDGLAAQQVALELPTASASIQALDDYIALWHNRYQMDDTTPEAEDSTPEGEDSAPAGDEPASAGGEATPAGGGEQL